MMFSTLRYITIVLIYCSLCTAEEHEHTVSNREIFFRLCDSVMSDAAKELISYRSIAVTAGSDSFSTYYQPMFVQGLAKQNIPLFVQSGSAETMLTLLIRESSLSYSPVFTESFFGSRKTERRAVLSIVGTLVSAGDGKILWTKDFVRTVSDIVPFAEIDELSSGNPPLTAYFRPELSFLDSILEPAIVTIASGVAIYLFFTIRS